MKRSWILVGILFFCFVVPDVFAARRVGEAIWLDRDKEKSLVYLLRQKSFGGAGRTTFLYVDEQLTATVDNGSYTAFYIAPGKHIFIIGSSSLDSLISFPVELESGKEYFFLWKYREAEAELIEAESGKELVKKLKDFVKPTEGEFRAGAKTMTELRQERLCSWSSGAVGLVDKFGDHLGDLKPRTLDSIKDIVEKNRHIFAIPEDSLSEVVVVTELADLAAGYSLKEGDIDGARGLLQAAVEGYGVAAELFEFLRRQERKRKWTQLIGYSLLGGLVATQTGVDPQFGTSAVSATAAQQRQHLREAEDARKFGKEAKRRLICIEKGGDSVIISHCVEGSGAQNSSQ
ncbi:MAG TPA: DUF2846 domain-containing protein [Thermoanaerobaculia bacterium]|nr:DUF2846 domain-containing protein [Thermoanaerobaculia bacterium]